MALKEKYEKFAQGMVIHNNATEAARYAGYTANSSHALANTGFRLKNLPEIKDRIKELEDNLETNVDVITEIERQYEFAKTNGHTNSAIKALELLSKIRGAKSDKEVDTSPEGLEKNIINSLNILGKKKVESILSKCDFTLQLKLDTEQSQQHQEKISEELQE
jgi:phage terminase small subunit